MHNIIKQHVFVHVTLENIPIGMPQPSKTPNSDVIPSLLATRLGHPMVILSKAHMNERTNERTNTHGFLINNVVYIYEGLILLLTRF